MLDQVGKIDLPALKPDPVKQSRSPVGGEERHKDNLPSPEPETPTVQTPQEDAEAPSPHLLDVRV